MAVVEMQFGYRAAFLSGKPLSVKNKFGKRRSGPLRIVHAQSDDGMLTWSYTAGLVENYRHPEFLLTGLDSYLSESVLGKLADKVADGLQYSESSLERNVLHTLTCAFREVPASLSAILMPLAPGAAASTIRRPLQCIYPDNHNRLPWHFGYNTSWHEAQPLFTGQTELTKIELTVLRAASGENCTPARHRVEQFL